MIESLYRLALNYLRKNCHLVNFTKLNHPVAIDMRKVIKNKNYLSNVLTCRLVHNWWAIDSYIVKYHPNLKYNTFEPCEKKSNIETTGLGSHIDGIFVNIALKFIYDKPNDIKYVTTSHNLYTKFGFLICNEVIKKDLVEDRYKKAYVFDNELFIKMPRDLINWAVENGYLSNPVNIDRKFLVKK